MSIFGGGGASAEAIADKLRYLKTPLWINILIIIGTVATVIGAIASVISALK
jgi:hypothetical protein